MNYYNKITNLVVEALSGATRAYKKYHRAQLKTKKLGKVAKLMGKEYQAYTAIPTSKKRNDYRSSDKYNKMADERFERRVKKYS